MFSFNVCLKSPHEQLLWFLVSECDDFEYCDITRTLKSLSFPEI